MKTPKSLGCKPKKPNQACNVLTATCIDKPEFALVKCGNEKSVVRVNLIKNFRPEHETDFRKLHLYQMSSGSIEKSVIILMLGHTEEDISHSTDKKRIRIPNSFFVTNTPEEGDIPKVPKKQCLKGKPRKLHTVLKSKLLAHKHTFDNKMPSEPCESYEFYDSKNSLITTSVGDQSEIVEMSSTSKNKSTSSNYFNCTTDWGNTAVIHIASDEEENALSTINQEKSDKPRDNSNISGGDDDDGIEISPFSSIGREKEAELEKDKYNFSGDGEEEKSLFNKPRSVIYEGLSSDMELDNAHSNYSSDSEEICSRNTYRDDDIPKSDRNMDTYGSLKTKNCLLSEENSKLRVIISKLVSEKRSISKLNMEYQMRLLGKTNLPLLGKTNLPNCNSVEENATNDADADADADADEEGFLIKRGQKIHLGNGIWISQSQWESCMASTSNAKFTKNLAVAIWGSMVLTSRSVSGTISNRLKNQTDTTARPPLTPVKMSTVKNCVRHFSSQKGGDVGTQDAAVKAVNRALAEKIADLRRHIIN